MTALNFVDFETGDLSQLAAQANAHVVTSPALSGSYSLRLLRQGDMASAEIRKPDKTYFSLGIVYYDFLFRFANPLMEGIVANFLDDAGGYKAGLHVSQTGKLLFYDAAGMLVETGQTMLSPNVTYRLGVRIGQIVRSYEEWEVRINGNVEMSSSGSQLNNTPSGSLMLCGNSPFTQHLFYYTDHYYDDVTVSADGYP